MGGGRRRAAGFAGRACAVGMMQVWSSGDTTSVPGGVEMLAQGARAHLDGTLVGPSARGAA